MASVPNFTVLFLTIYTKQVQKFFEGLGSQVDMGDKARWIQEIIEPLPEAQPQKALSAPRYSLPSAMDKVENVRYLNLHWCNLNRFRSSIKLDIVY